VLKVVEIHPCSLVQRYECLVEIVYLHHQGGRQDSTVNMEAACIYQNQTVSHPVKLLSYCQWITLPYIPKQSINEASRTPCTVQGTTALSHHTFVLQRVTAAACRTALHPAGCHVTTEHGQVCCILNACPGTVFDNTCGYVTRVRNTNKHSTHATASNVT